MSSRWPDSNLFWRDQRVAVTDGEEFPGAFIVEKLTALWPASGSTSRGSRARWGCRAAVCDNTRIYSHGWRGQAPMEQGIALTYPWIEAQVKAARAGAA